MEAARRSPVYKMAVEWKVALPLHPEYRTLPMVWYVPPLSPIMSQLANEDDLSADGYLPAIDEMRIPMEYLASILTAGDVSVIRRVLLRLTAMRAHMRQKNVGDLESSQLVREAGLSIAQLEDMARLFGVAKYADRFVIPTAQRHNEANLEYQQGACSLEDLAPPEGILPAMVRPGGGRM